MRVTVQHLHSVPSVNGATGFCSRGARFWCARHAIDWGAFVRDGIDAEVLLATGDAMAKRLVEHAAAVTQQAGSAGGS